MRYLLPLTFCIITALACPASAAYTLAFDDIPSGTVLAWSPAYVARGISFFDGFRAQDATEVTFGAARSAPNVVVWSGGAYDSFARILFGHYSASEADPESVSMVGGYFSTEIGAVVRFTAYNWVAPSTLEEVATVLIGEQGKSWSNTYVELDARNRPFTTIYVEGVSGSGLSGFCLDDLTVAPVPEPSSLLALLAGFGGLTGLRSLRRRRP